MNVLIVSLNFNPGHFSHLIANYKLLEDKGYSAYLFVDPKFREMDLQNNYKKIYKHKDLNQIKTIERVYFWFPSQKNIFEIIYFRILFHSKILYVFHEPFESIKLYKLSGFSWFKIIKICMINFINVIIILLSQKIILPSSKAFNIYKKKYSLLNNNFKYNPLLFNDEMNEIDITKILNKKQYISYIGTIAEDHAFDCFIKFLLFSIKENHFTEMKFLIASKSTIPKIYKDELSSISKNSRLQIFEGKTMTNEEINSHFQESLIVWNAYNRSMQSGVLPKAYMFGVAVLSSHCQIEFVDNYKTGIIISDNKNEIELKSAVDTIINNRIYFSINCRKYFIDHFYYKNVGEEFVEIN